MLFSRGSTCIYILISTICGDRKSFSSKSNLENQTRKCYPLMCIKQHVYLMFWCAACIDIICVFVKAVKYMVTLNSVHYIFLVILYYTCWIQTYLHIFLSYTSTKWINECWCKTEMGIVEEKKASSKKWLCAESSINLTLLFMYTKCQ